MEETVGGRRIPSVFIKRMLQELDLLMSCHSESSNAPVFEKITNLYLNEKDTIVDFTYGRGVFWKTIDKDKYVVTKQDSEGNTLQGGGEYTVSPYIVLRWSGVPGENYARSHCEDLIGDIKALEGFTLLESAESIWWKGI